MVIVVFFPFYLGGLLQSDWKLLLSVTIKTLIQFILVCLERHCRRARPQEYDDVAQRKLGLLVAAITQRKRVLSYEYLACGRVRLPFC